MKVSRDAGGCDGRYSEPRRPTGTETPPSHALRVQTLWRTLLTCDGNTNGSVDRTGPGPQDQNTYTLKGTLYIQLLHSNFIWRAPPPAGVPTGGTGSSPHWSHCSDCWERGCVLERLLDLQLLQLLQQLLLLLDLLQLQREGKQNRQNMGSVLDRSSWTCWSSQSWTQVKQETPWVSCSVSSMEVCNLHAGIGSSNPPTLKDSRVTCGSGCSGASKVWCSTFWTSLRFHGSFPFD